MTNPLIAPTRNSTQSFSGVPILESANDTKNAIESGGWASEVLGGGGTALDAIDMAMDPFAAILAAGVGWLLEHVGPVKQALDALTGNSAEIQAHAQTWQNVAKDLAGITSDMTSLVKSDTARWIGAAGDAYRARSQDIANLLTAAQKAAEGASHGMTTAGEVVGSVRTLVRDTIADLVGHLISWALQVLCTLGLGLLWVVPKVIAEVAEVAAKIAGFTSKLIEAMKKLVPLVQKLGASFGDAGHALNSLKAGKSWPHGTSGASAGKGLDAPVHPKAHDEPTGSGSAVTHSAGSAAKPPSPDTNGTHPASTGGGGVSGGGGPVMTKPSGTHAKSRSGDGNLQQRSGDPQTPNRDVTSRQCKNDPIDIASGEMIMTQADVEIAAALPLVLRRTHLSSYRVGVGFGASWASTVDQRLEVGSAGVSFAADDGKLLFTPTPAPGETVEFAGSPNTLTRYDNDSYTVTLVGEGRVLYFASGSGVHPLTAIIDRNGNHVSFEYDQAGDPVEIRHSGGYRVRVDTEDGLVTALHLRGADDGEDLLLMRYEYTRRRLTAVINASGLALKFDYDDSGRITGWTDRNGSWYRYIYDHDGRCVRTEGPGGVLTGSFEYAAGVTRFTNSLGHTTSFHLNDKLQTFREVDPLGNQTVSEWDDHDRLLCRTDALGRSVRYDYDDAGNLTTVTRPDGSRHLVEYNDQQLPVTFVDPDGAISRNEYDEYGNLTRVVDPAGAVTDYSYDQRGRLARVTDALGNVRRIDTDDAGLAVSVTTPLGATTGYRRDGFGRVIEMTDPLGNVTRFGWTVDGKPAWRTLPDGATERWIHDGEGNLRTRIDPLGQTTRTEMTSFDLPSVQVGPDGRSLQFRYDTELRLVAVTNEQGMVWQYEYDGVGNLVRETDFDGRVVSCRYDAAGQLIERTNGAGETVRFTYDVLGNIIERRTATATTTFTFDAMGRLTGARDDLTRVSFQLDPLGRVLAETVNGRTVASVYDPLGRRVHRRTPSGAESVWDYDADDRPVSLHTSGRKVGFDYDAAGREVRRTLGPHTVLTQSWNTDHTLAAQALTGSGEHPLQQRSYTYRQDGVLAGIQDQLGGPRRFDLDAVGRVTAVHGPQWTERYAYDAAGNLTHAAWPTAGPGSVDSVAMGDRDYRGSLITRAGNTHYTHDAEGRMTTRSLRGQATPPVAWRYTWDAESRLTEVLTPDGQRWYYVYDPFGRRIAKQRRHPDGSIAERIDFTWDGNNLVEQVHNGTKATVWEWEPGTHRVLTQSERQTTPATSQSRTDQRCYAIVTDFVGTPTEMVDAQGNLAWHTHTTLWGTLKTPPGNAYTPLRFPGQYHDPETGLHYNLHRYYDPATGRYATHDPLGLAPSPNPYTYVPNPTGWTDPLGLMDCRGSGSGSGHQGRWRDAQSTPNTRHDIERAIRRRDRSQNAVFDGTSAREMLRDRGLHVPPGTATAHLHMSEQYAIHGERAQRRDNLVPGTQATNLDHLKWENALRKRAVGDLGAPISTTRVSHDSKSFTYDIASPFNPHDRLAKRFDLLDPTPARQRTPSSTVNKEYDRWMARSIMDEIDPDWRRTYAGESTKRDRP